MTFLEFIMLLIVAGVCGAIGQAISGYSRGGCLLSIVIGFIGALIGMGLADFFNLPEIFMIHTGDISFPVLWSIIGATLFVALVGFMTRKK